MKIEKLQQVNIGVKNLDEAIKFFSDLFGTTFERVHPEEVGYQKTVAEHADPALEGARFIAAISPIGLELLQSIPSVEKEGVRSFSFKVSNLEEAKVEMKERGVRLLADIKVGNLKEAIFSPDDLHGCRIVLLEYEAPTIMDAILQK